MLNFCANFNVNGGMSDSFIWLRFYFHGGAIHMSPESVCDNLGPLHPVPPIPVLAIYQRYTFFYPHIIVVVPFILAISLSFNNLFYRSTSLRSSNSQSIICIACVCYFYQSTRTHV